MIRFVSGALVASACVLCVLACGRTSSQRSRVSLVSNERPTATGAPYGATPPPAMNAHKRAFDLPDDDEPLEPTRFADSREERALAHVHGPNGATCSGVVVGLRLVATAQRCLRGLARGVTELAEGAYGVEVASSKLTLTRHPATHAVLPACDEDEFDVALLVLAKPVEWIRPLDIASAPGPGAKVQALGLGHCAGEPRTPVRAGTVRSISSTVILVEAALCKGDVGGPVVDGSKGALVGLVSHRSAPEGVPQRTAAVARLDTVEARALFAQAERVASGAPSATLAPVPCP